MPKRVADESTDKAASTAGPRKRSRIAPRAPLPVEDDAWRRKLMREKEAAVLRAKTKQTYARVKARELGGEESAAESGMHPDRQAQLDDATTTTQGDGDGANNHDQRPQQQRRQQHKARPHKPALVASFDKARAEAEAQRAAAEKRAADRAAAQADRARRQKMMVRARRTTTRKGDDDNGAHRKLGRESGVLLERVRKLMGK